MSAFSLGACRHIVIEGPIGVGKSSLARRLAAHLQGELMMEKPQENPFLARFYAENLLTAAGGLEQSVVAGGAFTDDAALALAG